MAPGWANATTPRDALYLAHSLYHQLPLPAEALVNFNLADVLGQPETEAVVVEKAVRAQDAHCPLYHRVNFVLHVSTGDVLRYPTGRSSKQGTQPHRVRHGTALLSAPVAHATAVGAALRLQPPRTRGLCQRCAVHQVASDEGSRENLRGGH